MYINVLIEIQGGSDENQLKFGNQRWKQPIELVCEDVSNLIFKANRDQVKATGLFRNGWRW